MKSKRLMFLLISLLFMFCSSDSGTSPDPEPVTLEGLWSVSEYATVVNDENQIFFAPYNINTRLTIEANRFNEIGAVRGISFVDSGTVTVDGDSLRFYSQVYHSNYSGKLLDYSLVIRSKSMSSQYDGTAVYSKLAN